MANTTENLRFMLRRLVVVEGLDIEVATDKVLEVTPRAALVELVRPVVRDEARRVARREARRAEDAAFSHPPTSGAPTPMGESSGGGNPLPTAAQARQAIVTARFVTPDGNWVTWGQATEADHRARAEWQRDHAAACARDAARHDQAAQLIVERGVSCLDDIDGWADLLQDDAA